MARKIRLTGFALMVIIFIFGLIGICAVAGNNIGDVKSLSVTKTTQNSVELQWKRVGSADGYVIYQNDGEKQNKIATINDAKTTNYKVKKLADATSYNISVKAFKNTGKKTVYSEKDAIAFAYTNPAAQSLELAALNEGQLTVNWTKNERVNLYQVEYSKTKSFEEAESITIKDNSVIETNIEGLNVGDTYYVRVRSVSIVGENGEKIYGPWSKTASQKVLSKAEISKIDPTKPMIAVTFDDGPGYNGASAKILKIIEKYNIKATFFMVGKNAASNTKNVQKKVELGCQIGNHTYNHEHYGKNVTPSDILKATNAISKAGGAPVTCFRSPGGNTTAAIREECKKEGLPLYYWSLDTQDWKYRDANKVYNTVIKHVEDGDIILMHEIYSSTADAFEKMVPVLLKKGYQFVTCDELIEAKSGKKPQAGTQYVNGSTIKNQTS